MERSRSARASGRGQGARPALLLGAALLLLAAACGPRRPPPLVPASVAFVSRARWGARPAVGPMRTHVPRRITIHHTATAQAPARAAGEKLRALQQFSQRNDSLANGRAKPAWPDVPYHFYVAADGVVAEGREWRYVGDSNTPYDPSGHLLVVVEGNFETETLSDAQRRSLEALVPTLALRFGITPERLGAHRDFAETRCPGANLMAELPRLRALIAERTAPSTTRSTTPPRIP